MKVELGPLPEPAEREVTITMTESEARHLRVPLGAPPYTDINYLLWDALDTALSGLERVGG